MAEELFLSTQVTKSIFMTDSSNRALGKAGLTLAVSIGKGGSVEFSSISPTIDEGNIAGWYSITFTTSHTDTLGDFSLHVTGSGADATDMRFVVVPAIPNVNVHRWLTGTPSPLQSGRVDSYIGSFDLTLGTEDPINSNTVSVNGVTFEGPNIPTEATIDLGTNAPTNWINNDSIASNAVTKIQNGLATSSSQGTIIGQTNKIPDNPALVTTNMNINLSQSLRESDGRNSTTGGALNGLWGISFGNMEKGDDLLSLSCFSYYTDPMVVFSLNSASNPSERTRQ